MYQLQFLSFMYFLRFVDAIAYSLICDHTFIQATRVMQVNCIVMNILMKQIFHQSLSIFKLSCLPFSFVEQNVFIMYLMNLLMSMRPRVKEINVYSFFILCISIRESKKGVIKIARFKTII